MSATVNEVSYTLTSLGLFLVIMFSKLICYREERRMISCNDACGVELMAV